jgi:hypothetical protein
VRLKPLGHLSEEQVNLSNLAETIGSRISRRDHVDRIGIVVDFESNLAVFGAKPPSWAKNGKTLGARPRRIVVFRSTTLYVVSSS